MDSNSLYHQYRPKYLAGKHFIQTLPILGYLESYTSCVHRSMMHDTVAAAIRDKHSLYSRASTCTGD